jgi:HAD superfamily phosphoserine phosphatase-like hydrolase
MVKLVLFDMDGVIFDGKNFWLEFHAAMGTEKQAWQLWKGLGESAYRKLSHLTANSLWRGKSSETFLKMIWARKPVPGVDRVFAYLHDNNIRSAIVSSGPYHLAERARELFDVTEIRANKLYIDPDGKFTGEVDVQVDNNHKDIPAKELMTKFGASHKTTAMVGDTESDVSMAKLASLSIAYNCEDRPLLEACKYRLAQGEISKVVDLLNARK